MLNATCVHVQACICKHLRRCISISVCTYLCVDACMCIYICMLSAYVCLRIKEMHEHYSLCTCNVCMHVRYAEIRIHIIFGEAARWDHISCDPNCHPNTIDYFWLYLFTKGKDSGWAGNENLCAQEPSGSLHQNGHEYDSLKSNRVFDMRSPPTVLERSILLNK